MFESPGISNQHFLLSECKGLSKIKVNKSDNNELFAYMKNELPIHNSVDGNHHPEDEREKCKHFIISGEKSLSK